MMDKKEKTFAIKSITSAALILNSLGEGRNSAAMILEYSRLSKSTVHRLLKALVEAQLVIHDPVKRKYYLGELITKLASSPQISHEYLISCAHEEMEHLLETGGETVNLSIMVGLKCISVHVVPSKKDLRVVEEAREIRSIHAGAAGKVLLSQLTNNELKNVLQRIKLVAITENTVVDKEELLFQLKRIRQQGYHICTGERIIGAMGISTPVKNYTLPVALSIVGPEVRMKPRVKELLDALLTSSSSISREIQSKSAETKSYGE
jgi:DNA-binding IclR family transcriptional regulator